MNQLDLFSYLITTSCILDAAGCFACHSIIWLFFFLHGSQVGIKFDIHLCSLLYDETEIVQEAGFYLDHCVANHVLNMIVIDKERSPL